MMPIPVNPSDPPAGQNVPSDLRERGDGPLDGLVQTNNASGVLIRLQWQIGSEVASVVPFWGSVYSQLAGPSRRATHLGI
jgi:hypothetical protein